MKVEGLEYRVIVHQEEGSFWAEVAELEGCFATGDSLDELREALCDAIGLYLSTPRSQVKVAFESITPLGDGDVGVAEDGSRTLILC